MTSQGRPIPRVLFFLILMGAVVGCDGPSSVSPKDRLPPEEVVNSLDGLRAATQGNYNRFVEGNYYHYARHLFYMKEFPGDNVSLSGATTDPLFYSYTLGHKKNQTSASNIWTLGYEAIYGANRVIDEVEAGQSAKRDQLLGENYFLRALVHFQLVNVFGRPYAQGRDNLGIPIAKSPDTDAKAPRNTVGEVYDFVVKDLERAVGLMTQKKSNVYASKEVAQALLSRVHLYREENQKAIDYANKVINSGRYSLIQDSAQYVTWPTRPPEENPQTIFAYKFTEEDDKGFGAIGSMYYTGPSGNGWGEMYASKEYRDLLSQHPEDNRRGFIEAKRDESGNIQERNGYPVYYVKKFTGQGGNVTLSSPVILRLAEMYLNRAEARAKLDRDQKALNDVNKIRKRAGLSGDALYEMSDLNGAQTALDIVLRERRLELAFEGHRPIDLWRNGRDMVRSYPGIHTETNIAPGLNASTTPATQTIPADHPRVVHFLPEDEVELTGMTQNP
ncbi:RagB/SusD family nutrient uptake outer membrane protein [Salinibacter ruber]|uniref:RagB/SusD family nutrient uptake outer membrane protein n=1 Tax=Salinibacter ruber TaxID=146919 RepID=UPI00207498F5|nr:RagB/SusD family nutrient uptake outer membrane protein [Salinibacter ruber]